MSVNRRKWKHTCLHPSPVTGRQHGNSNNSEPKKLEVCDTVNEIEQIKARIEKNLLTTKKPYVHQIKAHDTMDNMNGRKCDVEIQF